MAFLWDRRRGLLLTGAVVAGAYYGGKYAIKYFFEYQKQNAKIQFSQENIKRRFEQNQQDCLTTVSFFLSDIKDEIFSLFDVESLKEKIKQIKGNEESSKREKVEGWELMKILCFKRTISSLYSIVLLIILVRIQINSIGRLTYRDSVSSSEENSQFKLEDLEENPSPPQRTLKREIERAYITFTWHYLHIGLKLLTSAVENVVDETIRPISLKTQFSFDDLIEVLHEIQHKLETHFTSEFLQSCLFPSKEQEEFTLLQGFGSSDSQISNYFNDSQLSLLLQETRDFIESPDLPALFHSCVQTAFSSFQNNLSTYFPLKQKISLEEETDKLVFPKIIPIINQQATIMLNSDNNFLVGISSNEDLEAFSAIVYSSLND